MSSFDPEVLNVPKKLPLLYIPGGVVLPGVSVRFRINSKPGIALIKSGLLKRSTLASTIIGVIPTDPQFNAKLDDNVQDNLGTAAVVVQVSGTNWPRIQYTILVTGVARFRISRLIQEIPYAVAEIEPLSQFYDEAYREFKDSKMDEEFSELVQTFRKKAINLLELLDLSIPSVAKLRRMLESVPSHQLADIMASIVNATFNEKLDILNAVDLKIRFEKALPLLLRQIEGVKLLQEKQELEKREGKTKIQKFKPKLRSKQTENENDETDEIEELEIKLNNAELSDDAQKVAMKEMKRLKKMSPQMPEYPMLRHYLELIADLPWQKSTVDKIDITKAREDLDADHYAMTDVKKRILEYLAVRQLKNSLRGPILCFVGPPGVGKTSIGKSIANTLGRKFHRISLGGVSDQSDIRGHRRTYIGSMPGRFVQGLKNAGVNNPVFLLDEIDKMSSGIHGDPSAALLEVLDPEQNANFVDHYLNTPFDLSQVIFIATANSVKSIPRPLLDRMELISIPGYTIEDKVPIAKIHLVPKQLQMHGLKEDSFQITEDALKFLISGYTLEAGVRDLERKLGALCRAIAVKMAEEDKSSNDDSKSSAISNMKIKPEDHDKAMISSNPPRMPMVLDAIAVQEILGHPLFENTTNARLGQSGVAVGLAWTTVGGQVMVVEATKMKGEGDLVLTGQLGDVMKESATLALSWIRSNSKKLGLQYDSNLMDKTDIHVHFPKGSISKDGPSAGVTITTALVSLLIDKTIVPDLAMTGEITLRGVVLPVGGIKEKMIAAYRSGYKKVILPAMNKKDLRDLPKHVKNSMEFFLVSTIEEVCEHAFDFTFDDLAVKIDNLSKL